MGPRKETSIDVRKFILRLFKEVISYREIAKIVSRSHSCLQKIVERFKSDGLVGNKSGRGKENTLSDVAKRKVLKDIKIDPKLSAVKLAAETSRIMGRSVSAEAQDNDPKHTARNVKMWCLFHCKQQLRTPSQSPDINVIEKLWVTLEIAVQKHQIRNKAHLKQVLQEEWDKISSDTTKKLVESVPKRLEAKGHATRY
ncbi:transposable element Tcb2 transposase [Trichonephila clavipes]|nr:transposable element Tcb2 transposase [Trichonephila clavipes]